MTPDSLLKQLTTQLHDAGESFSVERLADMGTKIEIFNSSETPKPFWRFDAADNLVETNQ